VAERNAMKDRKCQVEGCNKTLWATAAEIKAQEAMCRKEGVCVSAKA